MNLNPEREAESPFSQIYNSMYTTLAANAWEQVTTFTLTKPTVVTAILYYYNSTPTGLAISNSASTSGAFQKVEQSASDPNASKLAVTLILEAGTYYLLARTNGTQSNRIQINTWNY